MRADGEVLDFLSTLKKDNTGYHLKHLFIGSEGTLGIVTKVAILCPVKSSSFNISVLGVDSFENVLKTVKCAKTELNEILESCELMDAPSMDMVQTHLKLKNPIGDYPFYMFISTAGSNSNHDEEKLNKFLETCLDQGLVLNGTATNEPGKYKVIKYLQIIIDILIFVLIFRHFGRFVRDLRNLGNMMDMCWFMI